LSGTLLLAACCAQIAAPPALPAAPKPRVPRIVEVALRVGPTYITGAALPGATSDRRAGMEAALQVFYRTRYFLTPFAEGGYAFLSSGAAPVHAGNSSGPGTLFAKLDGWHISGGIAHEFWRMRAGAAIGFYSFGLSESLDGVASRTHFSSLGLDAFVGVTLVKAPRFFATFDLVTHNAPTADLHYFQAALTLHGDLLQR
jgi:hypothetical protein